MRPRLALVTALAATSLLTASPAHASHSCALDEANGTLDQICESHGGDLSLIEKLVCIVLESC